MSYNLVLTLLQIILVPGLIVVIIALIVIIIVLLVQLQRLRLSQRSPQSIYPNMLNPPSMGGVSGYTPPQSLQQPPQAIYANSVPRPAASEHKEEQVILSSQANFTEPPSSPRPIPLKRNDLVNDERWIKLVEECVGLFDDLDRRFASFDPSRQELAEHVLLQLQEILERSGVELIVGDATFERRRHQPEQTASAAIPGTPIIETLSPGFALAVCRRETGTPRLSWYTGEHEKNLQNGGLRPGTRSDGAAGRLSAPRPSGTLRRGQRGSA